MAGKRRILVTGPTGFIGRRLTVLLAAAGYDVRPHGRDATGELSGSTDWRGGLKGIDTVIHLAGRAHVMHEASAGAAEIYDRVNRDAVLGLGEQAVETGVRRIVFVSTSKVMGDAGGPFTARDAPNPADPYSRSKVSAEAGLLELSDQIEVVVIRPPLVYGPGVKGNFIRLLGLVDRGLPLPFSAIKNHRSLIGLDNLCDALISAIAVAPGIYLPGDAETPSTPGLVRQIARALGRPARLFPVPATLLTGLGRVSGRSEAVGRLTQSFTVDGKIPGWRPALSLDQGLAETARWYRTGQR